jgi:hypothetical protein
VIPFAPEIGEQKRNYLEIHRVFLEEYSAAESDYVIGLMAKNKIN